MRSRAHATSGGILCPPARSGSNRPNKTGRQENSRPFHRNTSSFLCRNRLVVSARRLAPRRACLKVQPMTTVLASDLPLEKIGRGKVRDIYAVGDDRVLLLTTDMISADTDEIMREVPALNGQRDTILGRAMLCRRTKVFPIECVIRGRLSGSA